MYFFYLTDFLHKYNYNFRNYHFFELKVINKMRKIIYFINFNADSTAFSMYPYFDCIFLSQYK